MHANAAQTIYRPEPTETTIPSGTGLLFGPMTKSLIPSDFLMSTVQMLAPISSIRLPMTDRLVDAKKVTLCFATPLIRRSISSEGVDHGTIQMELT